jgi:probable HAF family extracellular repeat protein
LGTLPGFSNNLAFAINDVGQVVGISDIGGGFVHGFRTAPGGKITADSDLGTLGKDLVFPSDINNSGQVVGQADVSGSLYGHAFFADATGPLVDLNDVIPAGSGWELTDAQGINDRGQIAGTGTINGQDHAFLLTPIGSGGGGGGQAVPLPPGAWAGAATLAGMGLWRARGRRRAM